MGCSTTPQSIKTVSATSILMQEAQKDDIKDIINTYDSEVRHWVDISFQQALEQTEKQLVDADGKVDLQAYKTAVNAVTTQLATVNAEYDKNRDEILAISQAKAEKAILLQVLIDQYEKSTGVEPETIQQLVSTLGETAKGVMDVYDKRQAEKAAKEAAKGPSMKDKLNTMSNDLFDKVYAEVQAKYKDQPILGATK